MLDDLDLLTLNAAAGNGQTNDPADVAALDNALRRIDFYAPTGRFVSGPDRSKQPIDVSSEVMPDDRDFA